jgi:hypothetical protein
VETGFHAPFIGEEPVRRLALEETSAVSGNLIEDAERVRREAERIIEELKGGAKKRFRPGKIDELRAYFQEEEHLSERESYGLLATRHRGGE